ncbi:MAG: hypothetical protein HY726_12765 [Candidatus Rokubacteria bacterium]|nr:hypothetical protein [Candidatus Rokubacteria bacterium]
MIPRSPSPTSGTPDLRRRLGVGALIGLLVLFLLLLLLPLSPGAVRLAGLSLFWWYGGVVGPLLAVLVASACLERSLNSP